VIIETPEGTSVHIRRVFAASVARVYAAFTEPERMAAWMWGSNARDVEAQADVRVGGWYEVSMAAPEGREAEWHEKRWGMRGVYAVVEPGERLVYTIHWQGPVGYNAGDRNVADEAAVVRFAETEGGAEVDFLHVGIPDDRVSAEEHAKGLAATFDDLAAIL
jgi:uncharacterized protein YndB with AHSA1/START domain